MRCLTFEQILQLHALVLFRDDGMNGVRDAGRLEAAIATQHQEVFGEAVYPTIYRCSDDARNYRRSSVCRWQ